MTSVAVDVGRPGYTHRRGGRRTVVVLLALAVFGLYGVTAGNLVGYDDETAAVAEGLVKAGQPRVLEPTPLTHQGNVGRGGRVFGRSSLTQPVLEVPFYWVGEKLDEISSNGRSYRWRLAVLRLYEPAMAMLTVLAIFGLLLLRGVSDRRALWIAGLAAVGTLIWPYSKIGMDTTLMAMVAVAMVTAAWTAARPTTGRFALVGVASALAINSKPYGALLLVGMVPLLLPPLNALSRERRITALAAVAAPVLVGVLAAGWYNWYRTGSPTNFLEPYYSEPLATPINAIGLFLSPGKGLILYSPLVVLGLFAMPRLWRKDRPLALAIVLCVAINTLVVATSSQWADETWGPRYLLASAWMLVLPLAWWRRSKRHRQAVFVIAVIAIVVQIAGVFARYDVSTRSAQALAREPVYSWPPDLNVLHPPAIPASPVVYGDDAPRWIPEASPLLFQVELLGAYLKEQVTGSGFVVSYTPFRGQPASIDLRHPDTNFAPLPDFWWTYPGRSTNEKMLAGFLALLLLSSATTLAYVEKTRTHLPTRKPSDA